jgi:ATP-dependent DNA helicase RecG
MILDTLNLATPVSHIFRLDDFQKKALTKLRISTVRDLLYHFPAHYGDTSEMRNIGSLAAGETAVVFGKISRLALSKSWRSKIAMATAIVEDESGRIQCVWFNQPYLAKMTTEGSYVRIEGKVSESRKKMTKNATQSGGLYFSNPKMEVVGKLPIGVGDSLFGKAGERNAAHTLYPVYPESQGITSNWMYYAVQKIFKSGILDDFTDPIPADILKKYNLPPLRTALIWIHTPQRKEDAEVARKRFAFEEIFFIQLEKRLVRREYEQNPAWKIEPTKAFMEKFIKRFPFAPTSAQYHAIDAILADFAKGHAMARLLEGDVGSGKTAVAAAAAYAVVTNHVKNRTSLQVAYMCPTEILAIQHFESFIQYFSHLGIQIGLITGSGCRKFPSKVDPKGWTDISRTQLLTWVADGDISILVGTHALIQKTVKFKNLALAIIDEQHRFGTNQRAELIRKSAAEKKGKKMGNRDEMLEEKIKKSAVNKNPLPHLLSMTATPIPRTLALTIYGDLDLTLLDQMPVGRKPIITEIVSPTVEARQATYEKIRAELTLGRQAYVICPRIDEPDPAKETAIEAKSVIEEAARLKASIFPEYTIGILHGKMKPDDKDKVMLDFKAGKIDILCATSVVEVGVNVPNATVIVIEGGERFGLAQLHQLRGRVIRSEHQAYCYVFTGNSSKKTAARLKALITAKNGFELAEYDLAQRGAGALSGGKQWGVSDIAMSALKNIKMVEAARTEAQNIIDNDQSFAHHPIIAAEIVSRKKKIVHFE